MNPGLELNQMIDMKKDFSILRDFVRGEIAEEQMMQEQIKKLLEAYDSRTGHINVARCRAETQGAGLLARIAELEAQIASKQEPRKTPIPPPGAGAFNIVYAEGWNACCDAYFGGVEPLDPVIITVTEQALQQPLSEAQIHNADPLPHVMFDSQRIEFARAIEAAHGIKEKP